MLFVLSGPSYVGKKTSIAHFMKLYSFSSVIPYTTKPGTHRIGETEGIQYHYVNEVSRKDIENEEFIYDEPFNFGQYNEKTLYGYKKIDIQNAIESYSNFIIHASVGNVEKIYKSFMKFHQNLDLKDNTWTQQLYFIFLDFSSPLTQEFFKQKQPENKNFTKAKNNISKSGKTKDDYKLGGYSTEVSTYDFKRRFTHAQKEIQFYKEHEYIFDARVTSDKTYEICEKLENVILPKLKVMPTSPDKIPGPLSDLDIIYMCEKRKNDPLEVDIDGRKALIEEIKKLLCGCGMHISLSNHIRRITRKPDGAFIDMADDPVDMEMTLNKLYPEETINRGYVLRPHEIILCCSDEAIKLPKDVYAMVASKFSYTSLGLSIELSPNIIQSGHNGRIHFQIKNNTENYICIYPHIQVAQILFFRTIQPSTRAYHEDNNHSYDRENIAAFSKFRNHNDVLDAAKKPKFGLFREIIIKFKEKIVAVIVGTILTAFAGILWAPKLSELLQNWILPVLSNLHIAVLVVLFAITSCIANAGLYIIGVLSIKLVEKIYFVIYKKNLKSDSRNME